MATEVAMVFDRSGRVLYWHEPADRTGGSLPDSRSLWDVLWENRENLGGVAHTHPWNGEAHPSGTDLSTFASIEAGLGRYLLWPIVTMTETTYLMYSPTREAYIEVAPHMAAPNNAQGEYGSFLNYETEKTWAQNIEELRRRSLNGG